MSAEQIRRALTEFAGGDSGRHRRRNRSAHRSSIGSKSWPTNWPPSPTRRMPMNLDDLPIGDRRRLARWTHSLRRLVAQRIGSQASTEQGLLAWGRELLPAHFRRPPSGMHRWLAGQLDQLAVRRGVKLNVIGPRGGAKSTLVTLAYVLRSRARRLGALHLGCLRHPASGQSPFGKHQSGTDREPAACRPL